MGKHPVAVGAVVGVTEISISYPMEYVRALRPSSAYATSDLPLKAPPDLVSYGALARR